MMAPVAAPDISSVVAGALNECVALWREEGGGRPHPKYDILFDGEKMAVAVSHKEDEADSRAVAYLGPDVKTAAAIRVGEGWQRHEYASYAVHTVSPEGTGRFPVKGFIRGRICDLAILLRETAPDANPETTGRVSELVRKAAQGMEEGNAPYTPESPLMTALLWLDGLLALRRAGISDPDTHAIVAEWRRMMRDGGAPVFGPAVDALERMGDRGAGPMAHIRRAADIVSDDGEYRAAAAGADLLPKLSADRQSAAEFYTRAAVAKLLAGLVISEDYMSDWRDDTIFQRYRLADLACGTGTLLRAGFERIRNLHEAGGGTTRTAAGLHRDAVRRGITGVDVYPAAAHMALSSLAAAMPHSWDGESSMGWMGVGGPKGYTGSIELVASDSAPDPGMGGRVATDSGRSTPVLIPDQSCDWIIMNPPYSRTRIGRAAFDIAGLSAADRAVCQKRWGRLMMDEPARKTAGMAATYVVIAGKKIKAGGRIGFVLPGSAAFVEAWSDTRNHLVHNYTDIAAVVFAGRRRGDSLSEDTSIGEMLLVAQRLEKPSRTPSPVYCATILGYPAGMGEAAETARAISSALERARESGAPTQDIISGEPIGKTYAFTPDRGGAPWSPLGVVSAELARTATRAAGGDFCFLDGRQVGFAVRMSHMEKVFDIGPTHHIIGHRPGRMQLGAFEIIDGRGPDMFMWTAATKTQDGLIMEPTHTGRAGTGSDADRERMRGWSGTLFYTRRIGWKGQRLLAATTQEPSMGGKCVDGSSAQRCPGVAGRGALVQLHPGHDCTLDTGTAHAGGPLQHRDERPQGHTLPPVRGSAGRRPGRGGIRV